MSNLTKKLFNRNLRKNRIRAKVVGVAERPRLTVTISNMHVSAQIIDDTKQHTIVSSTSVGAKQAGSLADIAAFVGADIAKKAKKAKISKVVLDRNGRLYAKRLNAFAEAARKEGLEF
ncbi:50S ribosomal protein L18 [Candidatus Saccharibacteria bacterium]|nr:50S ribosomal protein L18 [Candidatus Saccharibacteria bacterium]